jgi:hypothetical protein
LCSVWGLTVRRCLHVLGCLLLTSWAVGSLACESATFLSSQALYRDATPDLTWAPAAGATSYLVEIVARVPEGPVVDSRTLRTAQTATDLPKLDASRPTKISLTVTTECGAQRAPPASRSMVVMASKACAPVAGLSARATPQGRSVSWPALPGIDYEVRAFDAVSGALTLSLQTNTSSGIVIPGQAPSVVTVRPQCGGANGAASYLFVS